jgi:hypothetical protein
MLNSYYAMEEVVSDLLAEDIIPDILADVLAGEGRDYYYSSDEDEDLIAERRRRVPGYRSKVEIKREAWGVLERVLREGCGEICEGVVKEAVDDMVQVREGEGGATRKDARCYLNIFQDTWD